VISTLLRAPASLRLPIGTLTTPIGRATQKRMLARVFAPEPLAPDFTTRGGGALSRRPRAMAAMMADIRDADRELAAMVERYPSLRVPTAILFAREDRILAAELYGRRTADMIPGARFELVEGGHMLPVTQPERVVTFVEDAYRSSSG
jgi:pimeloyl-ACP methyl ester carboxylesterase